MKTNTKTSWKMNMVWAVVCDLALLLSLCGQTSGEWTTPVPVTAVNTQYDEYMPYLSYDGHSLYFSRGINNNYSIYEARRDQSSGPFTSVNEVYKSNGHVFGPRVSSDNLRMYYWSEEGSWSVQVSQRASINDPWSKGTALSLSSVSYPSTPSLSADELTMVFNDHVAGSDDSYDMYIATRPDKDSSFGNIRSLTELNTPGFDGAPSLSPDALSIYWGLQGHILEATRSSLNDPFGNVTHLSIFDLPGGGSAAPAISSDGMSFYFAASIGSAPPDIYVSYNVPEPATLLLLGLGAVIAARRR